MESLPFGVEHVKTAQLFWFHLDVLFWADYRSMLGDPSPSLHEDIELQRKDCTVPSFLLPYVSKQCTAPCLTHASARGRTCSRAITRFAKQIREPHACVQVSLVGDFDPEIAEKAFLAYMGTIPARDTPLPLPHLPIAFNTQVPISERHIVRTSHCRFSCFFSMLTPENSLNKAGIALAVRLLQVNTAQLFMCFKAAGAVVVVVAHPLWFVLFNRAQLFMLTNRFEKWKEMVMILWCRRGT